jgi:hypothetical protein
MNITNLTAQDLHRAAGVAERLEELRQQLAEIFSENGAPNIARRAPRTGANTWTAAQRRKFKATMRARGLHKA